MRQTFTTKYAGYLLQNATVLLKIATVILKFVDSITKCVSYYKIRRLLQNKLVKRKLLTGH